jgi:hypothetical protein
MSATAAATGKDRRVSPQYWHWKAAVLSAAGRAPIFVLTTYRFGWRAVTVAVTAEALYRAGTAGFFAAFTQHFRNRRPVWQAMLLIAVAIPAVALILDCLLHLAMGTPNLRKGMLAATVVSAATSLFNWYSMRRGTLLVGRGGMSLASDLCRLPRLILEFLLEPPLWMLRRWKGLFAERGT